MITSTGPDEETHYVMTVHTHLHANYFVMLYLFYFFPSRTGGPQTFVNVLFTTFCCLTSICAGPQEVDDVLVVSQVAQDLQFRHQSLPLI